MSLIPARVDSIALGVADVAVSTRFYSETMGFERLPAIGGTFTVAGQEIAAADLIVSFRLENFVLVVIDKALLAEEMQLPELPKPGGMSLGIRVSRAEVDAHMDRLSAAGLAILSPAQIHGAIKIGFAADPDGHVWEIIEDPLATAVPA
jgi:predicted lactoylglutathione lyase